MELAELAPDHQSWSERDMGCASDRRRNAACLVPRGWECDGSVAFSSHALPSTPSRAPRAESYTPVDSWALVDVTVYGIEVLEDSFLLYQTV